MPPQIHKMWREIVLHMGLARPGMSDLEIWELGGRISRYFAPMRASAFGEGSKATTVQLIDALTPTERARLRESFSGVVQFKPKADTQDQTS